MSFQYVASRAEPTKNTVALSRVTDENLTGSNQWLIAHFESS